jgi:molecular chaperone GrpE
MAEDNGTAPEPTDAAREKAAPAQVGTATLEAEVADLKDRLARTLAEMENLRKRTAREVADSRQYAVTSFARDMLNVADNLKRAIAAVPAELRSGDNKAVTAFIEGVEVTERGLEQTLTKFGVKPIDAKGEKFNPEFHQAVYEVETADVPPGSVADVMQVGYVIGDRVLRPAMVGVAKVPAAAPSEAGEPTESAAAKGN